ncbi:hypothetical protein [Rickettsia sp. Tenjiku01]|uniref:hypothetical protein n=1 Tax=Rickettsia sp. Tenjiku01 TaxID=1736693 RepID=UPI000A53DE5D|nr:hypothetical protein [Rickettsia sp. Tenjiku01]
MNLALNIKGFTFPSGHMSSGVVFYGIDVNCLAWVWTVFWGLLGCTISGGLFYKYFDFPQSKLNRFINLAIIVASVALSAYINFYSNNIWDISFI